MTSSAAPIARRLIWVPAVVLLAWAVLAALGYSSVQDSRAASTGSVTPEATVLPDLQIGGTCIGGSRNGSLSVAADDDAIGASCTVTFATNNNPGGVRLRAESNRPAGVTFCKNANVAIACGAVANFADAPVGGAASLADGEFGMRVESAPTCTTPGWANGSVYGLAASPGAGSIVCNTHAMGAGGSYELRFYADTVAAQEAGDYDGQVNFFLEAL